MGHTMQSGQNRESTGRGPNRIAARDGNGQGARVRIQTVALELFTEQGYDRTSLREIADRLGVTKAAIYYHFPTKQDIVESLIVDRLAEIDELIEWLRTQPATAETRREFVRRYAENLHVSRFRTVMRFLERNQTSVTKLESGRRMRDQIVTAMGLLSEPDAPLSDRISHAMSIMTLHASWFVTQHTDVSDAEHHAAALTVALDLAGRDGRAQPHDEP